MHEPKGRRVIDAGVAAQVREMLEGVLAAGGTASEVSVPGYTLAGKTGTAEVAENGTYSETKYVASFIGFAPAQDPQLLVAVIVDQPQGDIYGGSVAAPAFGKIAAFALALSRGAAGIGVGASGAPPQNARREAALECFGEGHPTPFLDFGGVRLDALAAARCRGPDRRGRRRRGRVSAYDSRKVGPGTLFFCVPGEKVDGHEFAAAAVEAGAAALVVERELELDVPQVVVPTRGRRWRRSRLGSCGDPTAELRVVGVTGTNGKTTTAFLLREVLEAAGIQCGLLGTVKQVVGGVEEEVERTTPEAIDLQATFRRMLEAGDRACVMEVSSHALALHRADAIHFELALFTNLTQDHLDFHADMEDYFRSKRLLFEMGPRDAIVNVDDPYGRRLAEEFDCVTFSAEGAEGRLHRRTTSPSTPPAPSSPSNPADGTKADQSRFQSRRRGGRGADGVAGALQRRQRARGVRRGDRARGRTRRSRPRGWRGPSGCRGASSRSTRGRGSPSSSTTPTRPTRWRTCCGRRGG